MPELRKFCRPEHNPLAGCTTIRLGTPSYFRELDPSLAIADQTEGIDEWVGDYGFDSAPDASAKEALSRRGLSGFAPAHIKDSQISVRYPDCLIWCCSLVDRGRVDFNEADYGKKFDPSYTSSFVVADPNAFISLIAQHLYNNTAALLLAREPSSGSSLARLHSLQIVFHHGPVTYADKVTLGRGDEAVDYDARHPPEWRPYFTKPKSYEAEREYRFACALSDGQSDLFHPTTKGPLDLKILPFAP